MKIKRIKQIKINSFVFAIRWTNKHDGGSFDYSPEKRFIEIGTRGDDEAVIFQIINHELLEIVAEEVGVRLKRPDCNGDYIFVYDHRQHETMCNMHAALLTQFIQ
ncbi:conserved hypothetical protein [uncultured Thiomicrorhabdus sp.]